MTNFDILKILIPAASAFIFGILVTPFFTKYFYKYKVWKRSSRSDTESNPELTNKTFHDIHNAEDEVKTPRIGGIIVWFSVLMITIVFYLIGEFSNAEFWQGISFFSRNQTWIILFALLFGSIVGLTDDLLQIFGNKGKNIDGIPRIFRITVVTLIALIGAWWFFVKLGVSEVFVPFLGHFDLGGLFIAFFVIVVLATYSSSVIDGVDGLSGGVLASAFASYGTIAALQGQLDLSAFCFVVTGAISAFLWFNIPPARFYMGETGMMGLTITLAIVAFFTDQVLLLPIIALPLVVTALSSFLQMFWLKLFKRKLFKLAPFHNYLLAIGWSRPKVTMRYWIISILSGVLGVIIVVLS